MAWDVHIHVCFPCDANDGVAELAKKHRPSIVDDSDGSRAAGWFLDDLSLRAGANRGTKGGLSLWGMVGNYTGVDTFCEVLKPFWLELLSGQVIDGPCDHEHVVVFEEQEQRQAATAYEIKRYDGEVVITAHSRLPFSWMQF